MQDMGRVELRENLVYSRKTVWKGIGLGFNLGVIVMLFASWLLRESLEKTCEKCSQ